MSAVVITQNGSIAVAIEEALGRLDLRNLISGRLVAIKPNETWASKEDQTGITQPETLRAVLRFIKQFGPREPSPKRLAGRH